MTATLMSAAETAFYHLGAGRNVRVVAETETTRMYTLGAGDEMLLVVVARTSSDPAKILPRLEETTGRMRALFAEA